MKELGVDDFNTFFEKLHGVSPFPWQEALAEEVLEGEGWPSTLKMPTGSGKTAAIDIAVFHLASQASFPVGKRTAPCRIFYVIDRRVVVDEAYRRARQIEKKLNGDYSDNGIVGEVSSRLSRLGNSEPLLATRMRGGIYLENAWTKSPTQPTICVTTVDQIGSRLMFRGYGVSKAMLPLHAGLAGSDALYILDEAHLSRPFLQTLKQVHQYHEKTWQDEKVGTPFSVTSMSATIEEKSQEWYTQSVQDNDREHDVLGPRLSASKRANLVKLKKKETDEEKHEQFVERIVNEGKKLIDLESNPPKSVIGIVVNRVKSARNIFESLQSDSQNGKDRDVILLTGRIRPYDRNQLMEDWLPRIKAGRSRDENPETSLFVVATQTIEVGADLDFDALVTELAPIDSLRQRFGRLDRFGHHKETNSVIVAKHDYTLKSYEDTIYGDSLDDTWRWLKDQKKGRGKNAFVDLGIDAFTLPEDEDDLQKMCAPTKQAPLLLPAHIDTLVQTDPLPEPDPDVSLYLHGPESAPADVQVSWRADLPNRLLKRKKEDYVDIVNLIPPTSMENLSLPIWAIKQWLMKEEVIDVPDVEGTTAQEYQIGGKGERKVLRWKGPEESEVINVSDIYPGDTVIVPSNIGGYDKFGFIPTNQEIVSDIGDICNMLSGRRLTFRIHPEILETMIDKTDNFEAEKIENIKEKLPKNRQECDSLKKSDIEEILELITELELPDKYSRLVEFFLASDFEYLPYPSKPDNSSGWPIVLNSKMGLSKEEMSGEITEDSLAQHFIGDDDTSYFTTQVGLTRHLEDVLAESKEFIDALGLDSEVGEDISMAARLHDIGKADPRFQTWLYGGDRVSATVSEPLAKSGMDPRGARSRQARQVAGYPKGKRHECVSVAMLQSSSVLGRCHDKDLVQYLIGTHHGKGRAFMPPVKDPNPEEVELNHHGDFFKTSTEHELYKLDSGWTERFWRLIHRYGYWGLAYLETIIRLSDHRGSEKEGGEA